MKGEAFRESFFSARSAHGPKLTCRNVRSESVMRGKADETRTPLNVRP